MTAALYRAMEKSFVGRNLTGYDKEEKSAENSFFISGVRSLISRIPFKNLKYNFENSIDESMASSVFGNIKSFLFGALLRQYGTLLFFMGMYTVFAYYLSNIIPDIGSFGYSYLIAGGCELAASIPLIASKKNLSTALCEGRLTSVLLIDILGIPREKLSSKHKPLVFKGMFSVITGTLLGALSVFVDPYTVLGTVGILLLCIIVFSSPESGVIILLALFPFVSEKTLAMGTLFTFICYLLKVARGKKTFKLELNDCVILAFVIVVILSNIFSINAVVGVSYSLKIFTYTLAYFLIVNTIKTTPWVKRVIFALCFSAMGCVVIGLLQKYAVGSKYIPSEALELNGTVKATFANPGILSHLLVLVTLFIFAAAIRIRKPVRKLFCMVFCVAAVFCLYATLSPFAIIAFVLCVVLFFLIYSDRTVLVLLALIMSLPFAKYIMPNLLLQKSAELGVLASDMLGKRFESFYIILKMIRDHFVGGAGAGNFSYLYASYAAESSGVSTAQYSIYSQMLVEFGIFGLFVFALIILVFTQNSFSFFKKHGGGRATVYSAAGFSGVFGLLLLGVVENVWQDPRIYFCFVAVMGLTVALKRKSVNESRGFDEYLDTRPVLNL